LSVSVHEAAHGTNGGDFSEKVTRNYSANENSRSHSTITKQIGDISLMSRTQNASGSIKTSSRSDSWERHPARFPPPSNLQPATAASLGVALESKVGNSGGLRLSGLDKVKEKPSDDILVSAPKRKFIRSVYDIWRTAAEVGKVLSQFSAAIHFEVQKSTAPDKLQAYKAYLKRCEDSSAHQEDIKAEKDSRRESASRFMRRIGLGRTFTANSRSSNASRGSSMDSISLGAVTGAGIYQPDLYIEISNEEHQCSVYFECHHLGNPLDQVISHIEATVAPAQ
jgi:hypothetical protein